MSLDRLFKQWDARYGIPRPTSALYLDYYQAGLRFLTDVGKGAALFAAGGCSSLIWWKIGDLFQQVGVEIHIYLFFIEALCAFIGLLEAGSVVIPYYRLTQRVTYGSARWADPPELKRFGLAVDKRRKLPDGAFRIGTLGKCHVVLPLERVLCHTAIFGPPGSGKSSSFFMTMAEDWSPSGSAIFLDPKGELFAYTARHFKRLYRLDLANPELSDRWNFVPACRGDAELAHEIASIIIGYDANKSTTVDPFWPQAETALLTALLLHLPQIAENPTPAHLAEFIGSRTTEQINKEMEDSPDPEARVQWGIFKKADKDKTQGGVFIGLGAKLAPLRSPNAMAVMQSLSAEDRELGQREIDLYDLRKPSTAVYVVVPEGDATRYKIVLSILFGMATSVTRKTSNDDGGAPVLLVLDEAGNIPFPNLSETLGVGRGRRCGVVLGYQNIAQLYKQYGRDGALAILGSVGQMIFLPALDAETAGYASKRIGQTTALQNREVDATGVANDNQGSVETSRSLIDAAELRQIPEHTQAVAVVGSVPPVRFAFPKFAKVGSKFRPLPRKLPPPVSLADAEAAFAVQQAMELSDASPGVVFQGAGAAGVFDDLPPNALASEASSDSGGQIRFDADPGLDDSEEDIDSKLLRLFDLQTPPPADVEIAPAGAVSKSPQRPQVDSAGVGLTPRQEVFPEMAVDSQVDPESVLRMADLDGFDEAGQKPPAANSGQLTFAWVSDGHSEEAVTALSAGGKGGRR